MRGRVTVQSCRFHQGSTSPTATASSRSSVRQREEDQLCHAKTRGPNRVHDDERLRESRKAAHGDWRCLSQPCVAPHRSFQAASPPHRRCLGLLCHPPCRLPCRGHSPCSPGRWSLPPLQVAPYTINSGDLTAQQMKAPPTTLIVVLLVLLAVSMCSAVTYTQRVALRAFLAGASAPCATCATI